MSYAHPESSHDENFTRIRTRPISDGTLEDEMIPSLPPRLVKIGMTHLFRVENIVFLESHQKRHYSQLNRHPGASLWSGQEDSLGQKQQ